ncbi:MAG: sensor histidine kinase, partial [Planctomycetaceae bacterium]
MTTPVLRDRFDWELAAEAITVRIRWFGLCVGYALVNFLGQAPADRVWLNAILTLGAVYALLDTLWSLRGKVFLGRVPLLISLMEAVFIGLLCHFDHGLDSPFRFYYFLSLLVCAIRYAPWVTYTTYVLHALSFAGLMLTRSAHGRDDLTSLFFMLVAMGWVTWASTALAALLKSASRRLVQLNEKLRENQALLEDRIAERTRELQESQALLVQREKQAAFGLLAAGIAHEVGNPLAAISSLVQMLNRRHSDEYTRERLQMVDDQLRRIQRTLRELVDFSRPATNAAAECDIHEIIDAALSIAKYYKRKKGKRIVTEYAAELPPIHVVRDQLIQVFLNLVLNALDATEEGGTLEIATSREGDAIRVSVRDDGCGVAPRDRRAIFEPYYTTKATGTGLGLFVCRKIMEQMPGGRIELAESGTAGTTFLVYVAACGEASE